MQPVDFPQRTHILGEGQPQYVPLPVHIDQNSDATPMTFCCEVSDEEIAEIVATKKIWFTKSTFGKPFQPVYLTTKNPFDALAKSPIRDLVPALLNDPAYREAWKANIAMSFYDAYVADASPNEDAKQQLHAIANRAADNFLNVLCMPATS
jgi:hypothetical protein